ncbi:SIMPL domain-containing protein [Breznakiellaceae bacterium SP9]
MNKKTRLLSLLFAALISGGCSLSAQTEQQLFTVQADAVIRVKPDKVVLSLGAYSRGAHLITAKTANFDIIKRSFDIVKGMGIPEKNIATDYVMIDTQYRNYEDTEPLYSVYQTVSITLEDVSKYDELITQLLNAGINQINSIDFQTTNLKEHRNAARRLAIAAAKERAALLAEEAGFQLGKVVNLRENTYYSPYSSRRGGLSNVSQNMEQSTGGGGDDSETLAPGMISIKADITLIYQIQG